MGASIAAWRQSCLLKAMTSDSSSARQQILETASRLFYQKGIQHVGINEVIAESGVAKRTLYRWFPSKDCLIEEVMKYCSVVALV